MLGPEYSQYALFKPIVANNVIDSNTVKKFEEDLLHARPKRKKNPKLAIDMSEITFVSSPGYASLFAVLKKVKNMQETIVLANVRDEIWNKLKVLGFAPSFQRTKLVRAKV